MTRIGQYLLIAIAAVSISACSSSVKRLDEISQYHYQQEKFIKVAVSLNRDAKEKLKDNLKFNQDTLLNTLKRSLSAHELLTDNGTHNISVVITDIRVRSNFSAVMWGFMAGDDRIEADIHVNNEQGETLHSFHVTASYALGGLAGGQDDARMGWLYEEFAKLTTQEILGSNKQAMR